VWVTVRRRTCGRNPFPADDKELKNMLARNVAALALLVSTIGVEYISLEDGGDAARAIQNTTARTSARAFSSP